MIIGFRAFPDGFAIVVLKGTQESPLVIASKRFNIPDGQGWSQHLAWVRRQVVEMLAKHQPTKCALKIAEPNARTKSVRRFQIEGVILEAIAATTNTNCEGLIKTQLKKKISGFTQPARYLSCVLDGHKDLEKLNGASFQDAAIVAIAMLKT